MKTMMRQMGPMIQRFQTVCSDCEGAGEIIRERDRCKQCGGKKTIIERKVLQVPVDRGVRSGTKIEFRGEGDQMPGVNPGDVVFEIEQKPHPRFERKGDDLVYKAEIDLVAALAGGSFGIEHLDERKLNIPLPDKHIIKSGEIFVIRGEGMPSHRHHNYGDLYVQFEVIMPTMEEFEEDRRVGQIPHLRDILPHPRRMNLPPSEEELQNYEVHQLQALDQIQQARLQNGTGMEEDDDAPPGAERVQCASQ
jgi:DnaJ family protein A protein 2